jgi:hypothetical protein
MGNIPLGRCVLPSYADAHQIVLPIRASLVCTTSRVQLLSILKKTFVDRLQPWQQFSRLNETIQLGNFNFLLFSLGRAGRPKSRLSSGLKASDLTYPEIGLAKNQGPLFGICSCGFWRYTPSGILCTYQHFPVVMLQARSS